ncbi:MAG: hypothetical protein SFT94_10830 [Pseudanabaenaceae cyanobacterium bins.68]|nr:hypothetical protein [Pseudanabaenaceae cyanobacterium bins.68]
MNHPPESDFWQRFTLLSAYLDQEASPDEIKAVEDLLRQDPAFYRLYQQQCQIRQLLVDLPAPSSVSPELLVNQVLTKLERQKNKSHRRLVAGGVLTLAVSAALSWISFSPPQWRWAKPQDESLLLVLERPILPEDEALHLKIEQPFVPSRGKPIRDIDGRS